MMITKFFTQGSLNSYSLLSLTLSLAQDHLSLSFRNACTSSISSGQLEWPTPLYVLNSCRSRTLFSNVEVIWPHLYGTRGSQSP